MMYLGNQAVGLLVNNPVQTDTGVLTIDSPATVITVQHNLDAIPDFAMIEIISPIDGNKIPYGSCVFGCYGYIPQTNAQLLTNKMVYIYYYRHATSGNFLGGSFTIADSQLTTTTFPFVRGVSDWAPTDTDGNPIQYRWVVGKLNKEVTPNA